MERMVLSLPSPALRFLGTPTHVSQDVPDMTGMILDAKMGFNNLGHSGQSPQVGGKPRRPGPLKQYRLRFLFLLRQESGATSRMGFSGQRRRPSLLQGLFPPVDRCGCGANRLGHLLNTLALQKHTGGDLSPHFQFLGSPFGSHKRYVIARCPLWQDEIH